MNNRVLHILSQRPSLTGSGITLDAFVRLSAASGWSQKVICATSANNITPQVGELNNNDIYPLVFNNAANNTLNFNIPGMSDVMPYNSTRFSSMTNNQLISYIKAWKNHIAPIIKSFKPHIIHSHHIWVLSSILKDIAPNIPIVTQCHATGLRQMNICPHLQDQVIYGCKKNDAFVVLHNNHKTELSHKLNISANKIHIIGAGFRQDLFYPDIKLKPKQAKSQTKSQTKSQKASLLYIGKYSHAKGLPQLLDAIEILSSQIKNLTLHVAGKGADSEALKLSERMNNMYPLVKMHGQLSQPELAKLMQQCDVCVLPSFYEGVPLVLVEAFACGCKLVSTKLPGIIDQIAPKVGSALELVELPRLIGADIPHPDDLPVFINNLVFAIKNSFNKPPLDCHNNQFRSSLEPFTWNNVWKKLETIWQSLIL